MIECLVGELGLLCRCTDGIVNKDKNRIKNVTHQGLSPFFDHKGCEREFHAISMDVNDSVVMFITPLLFELDPEVCQLSIQV